MTNAQWNVEMQKRTAERHYKERAFRKKCVTQGIVTFSRENGNTYCILRYRDRYVCTLFNDKEDVRILMAAWNIIEVAENLLKEVKGVEHESK